MEVTDQIRIEHMAMVGAVLVLAVLCVRLYLALIREHRDGK